MSKEEIQKYADELGQQYFPNGHNIWARENIEAKFVSEACIKMAEYVEQELIKKACEWMKAHIEIETIPYSDVWDLDNADILVTDFTTIDEMIENFEKIMEE